MNQEKAKSGSHMDTNSIELQSLKNASPTGNAEEAIRRNDLRFLAVKGFTITVPGIADYQEHFSAKYRYRIIEGTTDAPRNEEDRQLQNTAIEYAKSYNLVIRDYVTKLK